MRKYIIAFIVLIIVFLSFSVRYLQLKNDLLKEENSILINNQKAYVKENSILKKDAILFKFTVE
jgi:predicted RND superfamily exporter protein